MRSTLIDIARDAGVSAATVDRVLNNRSGARARTREIVMESALRLGYIGGNSAASAAAHGDAIRLCFVLPAGTNTFIRVLRQEIELQAMSRPDLQVDVETIEGFDPDALATALRNLNGQSQGIGLIALDHPSVREAIRSLVASGIHVVTIASDILHVPRMAYVGIDNRAAGRLAGYLVGRLMGPKPAGKAVLFAGSRSYRGHEEREMGFRHILTESFPQLELVEMREMLDDREKAYLEASSVLDRHPDLAAIYNVGAGNPGIARALKERGLQHSVVFVGHEATEGTRELLLDGTLDAVIDQNPRVEAREALNALTMAVRNKPLDLHLPRLQVIFKENIPEI